MYEGENPYVLLYLEGEAWAGGALGGGNLPSVKALKGKLLEDRTLEDEFGGCYAPKLLRTGYITTSRLQGSSRSPGPPSGPRKYARSLYKQLCFCKVRTMCDRIPG